MKKPKSLRGSVTLLITLCWVLPLLVISVTGGIYIVSTQRSSIENDVVLENHHNMVMTVKLLDDAIRDSRYASRVRAGTYNSLYEFWRGTPQKANYRYRGIVSLLNQLYLNRLYGEGRNYEMAGLFFFDDPDMFYNIANRDWEGGYLEGIHDAVVSRMEKMDGQIVFLSDGDHIYIIRNLLDRRDFSPFGTLVLCMRTQHVFNNFTQTGVPPESLDFWLNGVYGAVGESAEGDGSESVSVENGVVDRFSFDGLSRTRYETSSSTRDLTLKVSLRWRAVSLWPDIQIIGMFYILMSISSLFILFGVMRFFSKQIIDPLNMLNRTTKQLETGHLGVQTEPFSGNRDFQNVIGTFNTMSAELKKQFDTIYNEELALKDAKIMALRSQLNPHFLNNTLDLMNWQARLSGQIDISEMIGALSTLLDASMNRSDTREVTLEEEIAYADAFIFILSKRYGGKLIIEKDIDQTLLDSRVPPLVFQPLMENAVEHGFEKTRERLVKIVVRREGANICLEVINSGALSVADRGKIDALLGGENVGKQRGAHLGILNIKERLNLLYGESASFAITETGGYTVARITLFSRGEEQK
ncbi:MAG: histidine kinase [Oscillospiraceae bacterium]|jgi:two-component system sensor histidine kinase YesM|nr:histidine kinase [Oscillospiraceae bacterium]